MAARLADKPLSSTAAPVQQLIPMTGNEAIARGVWEAGVTVAAAYPGTPSTEILESLKDYPAEDIQAQWSTNEKVACDVAIGASFAGARAFTAMKHVGLNVASDSVMSQTYIGVNGGLVLAVCDDPGIHSSQNEQDTRMFAQWAMMPVLEPADAQEALAFTRLAFALSERFDTPVIVRSNTRLSHGRSLVQVGERQAAPARVFNDDPKKNVIIPNHARLRHPLLLEREHLLKDYFDSSELTRWEPGTSKSDFGIITVGTSYNYVKEVLPQANILKLAASYPLAEQTVRQFCTEYEQIFVLEELEPVLEKELLAMGLKVKGKEFFPRVGEFSPDVIREGFAKAGVLQYLPQEIPLEIDPVLRPPVLCAGCPHTASYLALRALNARVAGDIGCYTLAAIDPLRAIDTTVAMGSSIGNAIGMAKAGTETRPVVATIGDSTFLHAGLPALLDAVYQQVNITVILLDNHITAMTGGQDHPGTGRDLRGQPAPRVDFEQIIRALGVQWVRKVDPYNLSEMQHNFREAVNYKGVAVVIAERACVLDPVKIKGSPLFIKTEACTACQSCMNLGCPAMTWSDQWHEGRHRIKIDPAACIGCSLCMQVCPTDGIQPLLN